MENRRRKLFDDSDEDEQQNGNQLISYAFNLLL